ncbi:MAG: HD domain-containing phosphohydrolase [Desulfurivibrionaceae bacterium]|jgi:HD-GYP domain-containing protein (c-di-GMP phosphodiesterase class II)
MIKAEHYLKPAWVRRQFELVLPLLPTGSSAALQLGGKRLEEVNEAGHDLIEGVPGVQAFPLTLEGERVGVLLLCLPAGSKIAQTQAWGGLLAHTLQGMLETEHERHSVARETLESYREMASLQRAVTNLNLSLKPATVVEALLKEFDGRAADYGAVFVCAVDSGNYGLERSFGKDAVQAFSQFKNSFLFVDMAAHELGDIVNDLSSSKLWTGEVPDFRSLLWLPLIAHGEKLGLLVLASRRTEGFSAADLKRAQMLSAVAATALRNAQLYAAEQKMFQSFVMVISTAIDAKSPYTAGHCRRVPEIALMIAETVHHADSDQFAGFVLDEDERNTIEIAAMLHDCGKVVTPEWVVGKANKLDSIANRIHLIALRFEVLRRDALITRYRALADGEGQESVEAIYQERLRQLDDDFAFLQKCNAGGEFVSSEHVRRLESIARQWWTDACGENHPLLTENEIYNLSVQRGTLNPEERKIIEDHAVHTINMLSQISFPRSLRNVTEYAAGHHERMDGKGYPHGLNRDQLSIPARIMVIADIFEALTAPDRPYRQPGTLSWAIDIMHRMKLDNHIDGDLFDLFLSEKVYLTYARKHLAANQIDEVDTSRYLAGREA